MDCLTQEAQVYAKINGGAGRNLWLRQAVDGPSHVDRLRRQRREPEPAVAGPVAAQADRGCAIFRARRRRADADCQRRRNHPGWHCKHLGRGLGLCQIGGRAIQ